MIFFFRSIVSQYNLGAESAKVTTENNRKGCKENITQKDSALGFGNT